MGPKSDVMGRTSGVLMWLRIQSISVHKGQTAVLMQQLLDIECDQHLILRIFVVLGSVEIN